MSRKQRNRSFFTAKNTNEEIAEIYSEDAEIELMLPVNESNGEEEMMPSKSKLKQEKLFCFCNSLQSFCSELDPETQEPIYSGRHQQEALKFTWEEIRKYVEETEHIGIQFAIVRIQ